ncbi:tRNA threonylcarbamoyladenosine biosynthesis protein RimN [Actinobacillus delphinicola]|uniref:Sua5/YciO/YrdC/YwlC family protein n=1 Tax=Actinobacillus delphinicola TaxID=51161 RepID=UPI00244323F9|nr:Sua5/YciO/YrdC/YwlC family protein [Actinobacillus delphinicola]MDG6897515.1 tRNA threonylcarbamoyladenosine biosynthesis protein RimN [Actinobacillus delphinicola]
MNTQQIIAALLNDEVIAYPTEAVFGLGCNPYSETAIQRLLALKKRPIEKGLILIAPALHYFQDFVDLEALTDEQYQRLNQLYTPATTWIVPVKMDVPRLVRGKFDTIAIRLCAHPDVTALCEGGKMPLISTSANLTGKEPARTYAEVYQQFGKDFPVLEGQVGGAKNPSQIKDLFTNQIVRQG